MNISLEQRIEAQSFLLHLAEEVTRFIESHPSFDHTSWHIAPDLSWCSQEGTLHTDADSPLDNKAWIRNAPGCAITIVKV